MLGSLHLLVSYCSELLLFVCLLGLGVRFSLEWFKSCLCRKGGYVTSIPRGGAQRKMAEMVFHPQHGFSMPAMVSLIKQLLDLAPRMPEVLRSHWSFP